MFVVAAVLVAGAAFFGVLGYKKHAVNQNSVLGTSNENKSFTAAKVTLVSKLSTPVNGKQRFSVGVNVTNNQDADFLLSPGLQFWLEDINGNRYDYTAQYLDPGAVVGGPVAAYQVAPLTLDFTLPIEALPSTLFFQQDASSPLQKVWL